MVHFFESLHRWIGSYFFLLILGRLEFSSSALLFRDRLRHSGAAWESRIGRRRHRGRIKSLHVVVDPFDICVDALPEDVKLEDRRDDCKKHILTFQSAFERQSNPLSLTTNTAKLDEFLLNTDHLLSAGKSVHAKIVPTTNELLDQWTIACDRVGACPSDLDHGVIMSVRTAGISIPGLSVEWSALMGVNLVHPQGQYPELEFVLIKDENKVSSGAKPIVWLFEKLMRNKSTTDRSRSKSRSNNKDTKLFTTLGFHEEKSSCATGSDREDIENNKHESLVIRSAGTMEMQFRIPSMLGKLMFSSNSEVQKAKAEEQISNLITRQIEKDAGQNVLRWEQNFRSWTTDTNEST